VRANYNERERITIMCECFSMSDCAIFEDIKLSLRESSIFELIKQPIKLPVDDIIDLDNFKLSLETYFSETGFGVKPEDVIIFEDTTAEDWEDVFDENDDEFELIAFEDNGNTFSGGTIINMDHKKPKRVIKDTFDYSYRPYLPKSNKTWESITTPPPSPVMFEDDDNIHYPTTPTPSPPPPYRESFENFITNGTIGENGKIRGKTPTPYNYVFSIKVKQAFTLRYEKLKGGGFKIIGQPNEEHRPRLLKPKAIKPVSNYKTQICKHGKSCHFREKGICKFAHTLKEWNPITCKCDTTTCDKYHPHRERKIEYYRRRHNKK
jgi:hypothetical protein